MQPTALEAISRAEVDVAISTARKYPQHAPEMLSKVKQNMMSFATLDTETAEACFYTLPRGGKNIQGPSVRLAEIAVSCYGNMKAGTRIISTVADGPQPHVVIQAVAMDLERNVSVSIEKRRRITKKKFKETVDEDDINLATNAASSIALRDAVFRVIPMALIKPVLEAAKKVAIGDARTLSDRRARSVEAFSKMGVQKDRLLAKLERRSVEDITLEDIETLLGLHNAIKEGDLSLDEAFPAAPHAPSPTGLQQSQAQTTPLATPQPAKNADPAPVVKKEKPTNAHLTTPDAPQAAEGPKTPPRAVEPAVAPMAAPQATPDPTVVPEAPAAAEDDGDLAPQTTFVPRTGESEALTSVRLLLHQTNRTEDDLLGVLLKNKVCKAEQKLSDLSETKLLNISKAYPSLLVAIKAAAQATSGTE